MKTNLSVASARNLRPFLRRKYARVPENKSLNMKYHRSSPINRAASARNLFCLVAAAIAALTIATAEPANAITTVVYSLTTQNDPVAPGHVLEFDATVTNLNTASQSVVLNFIVPLYTTYGGLSRWQPCIL